MDTFGNENVEGIEIPTGETQPLQQPAAEPVKPEKKPSPFADSPYVTGGDPVNNGYNAPQAAQKSGKLGNKIAAVIAVIALVICCCAITASVVNVRWEVETGEMKSQFTQQIQQLQEQIAENGEAAAKPNSSTGTGIPIATPEEGLTPGQVYAQNAASVVLIRGCLRFWWTAGHRNHHRFRLCDPCRRLCGDQLPCGAGRFDSVRGNQRGKTV